jgi:hypothetical protein
VRKAFLLLPLALLISAGCRAQMPPTKSVTVVLSWTAAPGCTTADPCTYVVSRAVCPTASTCPSTTGTAYTPLNPSLPVSGATYTDATPPAGALVSYIAQTVQGGLTSLPSGQSNNGIPTSVPAMPGPPSALGGATQSAMLAPPVTGTPEPMVASVNLPQPMNVTVVVRQ